MSSRARVFAIPDDSDSEDEVKEEIFEEERPVTPLEDEVEDEKIPVAAGEPIIAV